VHEYGLMEDIVAHAIEEAHRQGGRSVARVCLEVGELASASVQALVAAFQALSPGTLLDGATLEVADVPGRLRCDACGFHGTVRDAGLEAAPPWICPACGSLLRAVEGKDIVLREITVWIAPGTTAGSRGGVR